MASGNGNAVSLIPQLRRFARLLTGDAAEADDLVEHCLIRANADCDPVASETQLRLTLYRHLYENYAGSAAGSAETKSGDRVTSIAERRVGQGGELPYLSGIERILAQLPREQRVAVILVTVIKMTYEETAIVCGLSVAEIAAHLATARVMILGLTGPRAGGDKKLAGE